MKKMFNEGNQIHNFMPSSGSGSDFLTSYSSSYGSGSTSQKVTVPVPVPQHWTEGYTKKMGLRKLDGRAAVGGLRGVEFPPKPVSGKAGA
jgi:hypothetical protein